MRAASRLIVLTGLLLGCASGWPQPAGQQIQIIVTFQVPVTEQTRAALLADIGKRSGAELGYLRAMSGHAHLLSARSMQSAEQLMSSLRAQPEVEDVSLNVRRQIAVPGDRPL